MLYRNLWLCLSVMVLLFSAPALANDKPVPIELDHFIGYWQAPDNEDNKMAIVRPDGGWLGKAKEGDVEVHSDKRAWKGWIEDEVLKLSYLPRAEEMNQKIPESVRKDLDGVLEWKMEMSLSEGAYGDELKAVWYRGHIEWEKQTSGKIISHEITGDGEPIEFTLKRKPMLQIEMGGGITLDVRLAADIGMDRPEGAMLQNYIQHQPLFAFVRMPEHEADKVGQVLTVDIKGTKSGDTQSIRLYRVPSLPGKRVIYTHKDEFSLGSCGISHASYDANVTDPLAMLGYVSSLYYSMYLEGGTIEDAKNQDMKTGEGSCKDFDGQHMETVEFTYKDAAFRVQYFDHWIGYTLARQESAMRHAHLVLKTMLKEAATKQDKENAAKKLQMIEHYWHISDEAGLTPLHKVALGGIYLGGADGPAKYIKVIGSVVDCPVGELTGLLDMDPKNYHKFLDSHCLERPYEPDVNWAEAFKYLSLTPGQHALDRLIKISPDIEWVSPLEQNLVTYAIKYSGTKAMNDVAKQFTKTGVITLYQVSTNISVGPSAADMYMAFTGYDIMGKKVSKSERIIKGIQVGADIISFGPDLHEAAHPHMFFSETTTKKNKADTGGWLSGWSKNEKGSRSSTHLNDIADSIVKKAEKQEKDSKRIGNKRVNSQYGELSGWARNFSGQRSAKHLVKNPKAIEITAVRKQAGSTSNTVTRHINGALSGDVDIVDSTDTLKLPSSLSENQKKTMALNLSDTLPKPNDKTVKLKTYPDLKMKASGDFPAHTKTRKITAADIQKAYGDKTQIISDKRLTQRTPPAHANAQTHINASHILSTQSERPYNQVHSPAAMTAILDAGAANGTVSMQGRKHAGVTQPYNVNTIQEFYRANGYDMVVSDPKMNKRVNAKDVSSAVKSGAWVETVMDIPSADGTPTLRKIIIEDVLLDADGTPTKIAAFDPQLQKLIKMDAEDFNKTIARDIKQGNMRIVTSADPMKTQAIAPGRYVFPDNTKTVKLDTDSAPTIKIDPASQKTIQIQKTGDVKHFSDKYDVDKTAKIDNATFRNKKTENMDADIVADAKAQARENFQKRGTENLPADSDIVQQQKDLYQQDFQNKGTEKINADDVKTVKADADLDPTFGTSPDPKSSGAAQDRFQGSDTEKIPADIAAQEREKFNRDMQGRATEDIRAGDVDVAKNDVLDNTDFGTNPDPDAAAKQHQKNMDSDFARDPAGHRTAEAENTIQTGKFKADPDDMNPTTKGDASDSTPTQRLTKDGEDNHKTLPPAQRTVRNTVNAPDTAPAEMPEANSTFSFKTNNGEDVTLPLGEAIGEGLAAKVYTHADNPDVVIKVSTASGSGDVGSKIDDLGRIPFESTDSKIDAKYLRVPERGQRYTTSKNQTVQIIERAKGELANKILDKQDKIMTEGQAYAFERASRMINEEGFVWLDNHNNNFHLVKIADGDEWKIEIVDTGGIIPAKGSTKTQRAQNARKVQRAVNNPALAVIEQTKGKTGYTLYNDRMGHILHGDHDGIKGADLLDFDAIQNGFDPDDLQFNPEIAYNQAYVRGFASMSDQKFKAYSNTISINAKPKSPDMSDLLMPKHGSYVWVLPHFLNYSYQMSRDIDGMRHNQ